MNGSALRPPCFGKKPIVANTRLDVDALSLSMYKVLPHSRGWQLQASHRRLLALGGAESLFEGLDVSSE